MSHCITFNQILAVVLVLVIFVIEQFIASGLRLHTCYIVYSLPNAMDRETPGVRSKIPGCAFARVTVA